MSVSRSRILIASACVVWLAGCSADGKFSGLTSSSQTAADATAPADPATTGSVGEPTVPQPGPGPLGAQPDGAAPALLGSDPADDLSLGKRHFRAGDFGTAERHFRQAAERHPRDAEAWLGLAASYDRLKRFELADRAYQQALSISGPRVEILNNQGFSYMLRGDYRRAREKLRAALVADPANPHVKANLKLLEESTHKGKGLQ